MSQEVVFRLHTQGLSVPEGAVRGISATSLDVSPYSFLRVCTSGCGHGVAFVSQTWWQRPHASSQAAWVQVPAVPRMSCMSSEPQFSLSA